MKPSVHKPELNGGRVFTHRGRLSPFHVLFMRRELTPAAGAGFVAVFCIVLWLRALHLLVTQLHIPNEDGEVYSVAIVIGRLPLPRTIDIASCSLMLYPRNGDALLRPLRK